MYLIICRSTKIPLEAGSGHDERQPLCVVDNLVATLRAARIVIGASFLCLEAHITSGELPDSFAVYAVSNETPKSWQNQPKNQSDHSDESLGLPYYSESTSGGTLRAVPSSQTVVGNCGSRDAEFTSRGRQVLGGLRCRVRFWQAFWDRTQRCWTCSAC